MTSVDLFPEWDKLYQLNAQKETIGNALAVYTINREGYITYFNKAAAALWGRSPDINTDMWCGSWKRYSPNGKQVHLEETPAFKALTNQISYDSVEVIIETPDHLRKNALVYSEPIFGPNQEIVGAQTTLVDISAIRNNEIKQSLLSAIVESSDDAIISKNLEGIIMSWNSGAERIFGYTEQEIIGKPIYTLIPAELQQEETVIIESIKRGEKIDHYQTIRISKSGQLVHVILTISPVRDSQGNIIGASKIAKDITEQLKAQELIAEKTRALETLNSLRKHMSEPIDIPDIMQKVIDAALAITIANFGVFYFKTNKGNGPSEISTAFSGNYTAPVIRQNLRNEAAVLFNLFRQKRTVRIDDTAVENFPSIPISGNNSDSPLNIRSCIIAPLVTNAGEVLGGILLADSNAGHFNAEHEDLISNIVSQVSIVLDNFKLFDEIKVLSARKDEFIALAGHELRSPLTSIRAYVQLLDRQELNITEKQFINRILYQLDKVNLLVGDLLDVSKIESGKLQLNLEDTDIIHLAENVIDSLRHNTTTHEIIFVKYALPILISADKLRIEQVLINLINNAIKYSPGADKVWVSIHPAGDEVKISIRDKGQGLSKEDLQKIFTPYYRVDDQSKITGLGLGLYLSKEFIEKHKGRLEVNSWLGKGSDFSFFLPINSKT